MMTEVNIEPLSGDRGFVINVSIVNNIPSHYEFNVENFSCRLDYQWSNVHKKGTAINYRLSAVNSDAGLKGIDLIELDVGYSDIKYMKKIPMKIENGVWNIYRSNQQDPKHRFYTPTYGYTKPHIFFIYTKPTIKKRQGVIQKYVESLFMNHSLADIKFVVNGHEFPAHNLIVAAGSPVLATMFQNDFKEKQTRIVTIEDTSADTFKLFLNYLYTGDLPTASQEDLLVGLFQLAHKYEVTSLKEEMVEYIVEELKVENAADILIVSYLFSSTNLYDETLAFIAENSVAICSRPEWLDLVREYPELCFNAFLFILSEKECCKNSSVNYQ